MSARTRSANHAAEPRGAPSTPGGNRVDDPRCIRGPGADLAALRAPAALLFRRDGDAGLDDPKLSRDHATVTRVRPCRDPRSRQPDGTLSTARVVESAETRRHRPDRRHAAESSIAGAAPVRERSRHGSRVPRRRDLAERVARRMWQSSSSARPDGQGLSHGHPRAQRSHRRFVAVSCAAIADDLPSPLFGHKKGGSPARPPTVRGCSSRRAPVRCSSTSSTSLRPNRRSSGARSTRTRSSR